MGGTARQLAHAAGFAGFNGFVRGVGFFVRFAGAAGKPFPSENDARDRSSGEAAVGAWAIPAIHGGGGHGRPNFDELVPGR